MPRRPADSGTLAPFALLAPLTLIVASGCSGFAIEEAPAPSTCSGSSCAPGADSGAATRSGTGGTLGSGGTAGGDLGDDAGGGGAAPGPAPTCTDGAQNGDETDVDCGGSCPVSCAVGKGCEMDADCTTACDYSGHCAVAPSCAQHHGGDTCGPGPDGDANGVFESCCTSLPIPGGTSVELDKYVITAGRMRAFVDALGGNIQGFTQSIPADNPWWNHAWDAYMPSTPADVDLALGPYPAPLSPDPVKASDAQKADFNSFGQWREGCSMGQGGARTWWSDGILPNDTAPINYSQDVLDEKMLNCVDAYFTTALCIYDGGHLATTQDLVAAWGDGPYPWSDRIADFDDPFDYCGGDAPTINGMTYSTCTTDEFPAAVNPTCTCYNPHWGYPFLFSGNTYTPTSDYSGYADKVIHEFGPQFTGPFTYTWPTDPGANGMTDNAVHIAAPGRAPGGANKYGHMDLAGLTFEQTAINPTPPQAGRTPPSPVPSESMGGQTNGSWESHAIGYGSGTTVTVASSSGPWWAYWAMAGRCAHGGTPSPAL